MTNPPIARPSESVNPSSGSRRSRVKLGSLPLIVLALLWCYVAYRLGTLWHSNPDYAFGWCVPILCLVLVWERWKRRPHRSIVRPGGGTFLLFGIFSLVLLPAALFLEIIPFWRFAGWIFAVAALGITFIILYFLGGRSWARYFAFPLIFFLIAVPWPDRLERPLIEQLSHLNASVSATTANALGSPAICRGTLIETGAGLVGVDEACSGIRSFQASVMIALFLGELFSYGILTRGILLLGAVALAFAGNVVRTTYLVRIADLHGLATVNLRHDQAGLAIMGITLLGLLVLVWLLRFKPRSEGVDLDSVKSKLDEMEELHNLNPNRGEEKTTPRPEPEDVSLKLEAEPAIAPVGANFSRFIKAALVGFVVWMVLMETGIYFWFRPVEKQAIVQKSWTFKLPVQSREYREMPVSENVREMLSFNEGHNAEWRDTNGSVWQVFYFRWLPAESRYRATVTTGQARGHGPEICLKNAGMILQTNLGTQTMSLNGALLRVTGQRFLDQGRNFHVFACYWEPREWISQAVPGTMGALRSVVDAVRVHDRGWNEKRVIKLGVWGVESDQVAQAGLQDYLKTMISAK